MKLRRITLAGQPRCGRWVATYGHREEMTKVEDRERIRWAHFRKGVSVRALTWPPGAGPVVVLRTPQANRSDRPLTRPPRWSSFRLSRWVRVRISFATPAPAPGQDLCV